MPKVLTHCSSFIEARGIVDGIYRLSGSSSSSSVHCFMLKVSHSYLQVSRPTSSVSAWLLTRTGFPTFTKIGSSSRTSTQSPPCSRCTLESCQTRYISPCPAIYYNYFCGYQVCTFHLYDKFVEAARSGDDVRLPKLRDVVSQLPPPNYRFLLFRIILTSAQSHIVMSILPTTD